ncbi:Ino eighty subunit 6 [Scheffersomyces stipitis CBS 6054]|uniref:Ino eighty subunit 6 n=1 Tax=Scheffersomyces stipitis (strain ATCC 58785 / CBS 6054 / NBRC 10063 / NRRL Y-11545) TaxID=322104 RepID=A3GF12_PICST|nr:Ino eighty subunit 6 [Scheffersomyces stipitis CBS 6054]EAZ63266.1 Ino eighty subunit 6 [Scheffersomyces stipitis CBS 6054]
MSAPEKQPVDLYKLSEIAEGPHSFKQNPNRLRPPARRYKPARQVIGDEQKYLQTKENIKFDTPTWFSVAAPPSLVPQKHYCDITGLRGKYKNPANSLRFHNVEIYQEIIKNMPPGVDQEYLELRGANVILK